ncbi:DUF2931 family protein [Porphyrobacter sp. AAP60]|uniref:DUF2931 family protein n=1 Tax=Porphyrobacter sp. AAP60 TaxID=1523423 RepID=UPI001F29727F|nr:DUF2931 family protein [Porphyrobacter sp. AAP60]
MISKFEWYASESAPKDYPAYLLTSFLLLRDGNTEGLPSDRVVSTGWGELGSIQLIGDPLKAPPEKLDIRWYDLLARTGFGGEIDLDTQNIEDRMRAGLRNEDGGEAHRIEAVLFGMAPGGNLAVWVTGGRVTHLVSMHRLPMIEIPIADMSNDPADTHATFANRYLDLLLPEKAAGANRTPPPEGQWQAYAQRSDYRPLVTGEFTGDLLWMTFLNGETDWFDLSGERDKPSSVEAPGLALPVKADFTWTGPTGRKFVALVEFDEAEVREAFARLSNGTDARPMVIEFEPVESTLKVDVFLRAGKQFYRFEKLKSVISAP